MMSSLNRTEVALQGLIDSLVRMSERHDPHTAGSARRVAMLAVALAREAGLDCERQHALRVAALLHDNGNIAIPGSLSSLDPVGFLSNPWLWVGLVVAAALIAAAIWMRRYREPI